MRTAKVLLRFAARRLLESALDAAHEEYRDLLVEVAYATTAETQEAVCRKLRRLSRALLLAERVASMFV